MTQADIDDPFRRDGICRYHCLILVSEQAMRRRELITLLSGLAVLPFAARAQQQATPVIGFLSAGTLEMARDYVAAFHRSLADAGVAEGRNVGIEYRWSEGHNDRLPAQAAVWFTVR
jgi:putative ABC transport system substrate-binding protein